MFNPNKNKANVAHLILIISWSILTLTLLISGLYFERGHHQANLSQALNETTLSLSDKIDEAIDNIQQSIYTLPVTEGELNHCNTSFIKHLKTMIFNHPILSGILITNASKKILCSTLNITPKTLSISPYPIALLGPYKESPEDKPAFVLQHQISHFYVDVFLLRRVLEDLLINHNPLVTQVSLIDNGTKNPLIQINRNAINHTWSPVKKDYLTPYTELIKHPFSQNNLQNIPRTSLVLTGNDNQLFGIVYLQDVLAILLILAVSLFCYFFIKKLVTERYSLNQYLKTALANNQFFPAYQLTYCAKSKRYVGAEVLLRLKDENDAVITPHLFIESLEQSGLIVPITEKLIQLALAECQPFLKYHPDFHLSFNLSAYHFLHQHFIGNLIETLKTNHIEPYQILLELTERDLIDLNNDIFISGMKHLRKLGFQLAVDDFGTGHASIGYLQHFPFTHLKIDQIFVQSIGSGAITESLNASIIHLAKQLHLKIIAEGVETEKQFNYLMLQQVEFLQGWYFSKAVSFTELINIIALKDEEHMGETNENN